MSGHKSNKEGALELAKLKDADEDSVRSSNRIIQPSVLRPLRRIKSATNKYINSITHPWDDNGGRLLPAKKVTEYLKYFSEQKEKFDTEKSLLRDQYDAIILDAQNRLKEMFKPEEFPLVDEWLDKYGVRSEMETISDSDTRIDNLDSKVMRDIQEQVEQNVTHRLNEANRNNYFRIIKAIEKLIDRLSAMESGDAERFRTSTYDAVTTILNSAHALNFAEDKVLTELINKTQATFNETCASLKELKENSGESNPKRAKACKALKSRVADLMTNLPS